VICLHSVEVTAVNIFVCPGSGESGKSTIVKQMKIIHQNGYSAEELALYRSTIFKNLLESIRGLIDGMKELELKLERPENEVGYWLTLVCMQPTR
jgi:hypothetical protein